MNEHAPHKTRLSALVICRNEAAHIGSCLESLSFADEIIVVDSGSTDGTIEIARNYTASVFVTEWKGFAGTKQYGLERASGDWVLWIDSDERVSPELADEIRMVLSAGTEHAAFRMPRRAYFLGRWIKHSGWYPGHVVRLFNRGLGRFGEEMVHESLHVSGSTGTLNHDIDHYTDNTIEHYFNKFNTYTSLAAEELVNAGKKTSLAAMLVRSWHMFFKMYIANAGFLDGIEGLLLAFFSSFYVFVKYAKLRELIRTS